MDISINLFVQDIKQSIKFYKNVFGASIQDGCHFKIENYPFALAEVKENTPKSRGGVGLCLQIYLKDVDNWLLPVRLKTLFSLLMASVSLISKIPHAISGL